jgi:hypothetical protein
MKKIFLVIACTAFLMTGMAQKTIINDPNAQPRTVGGFHGIEVSNAIDLYISQGNEEAVAVSAKDAGYLVHIRTEVSDGILKIWDDNRGRFWQSGNKKIKAYISFKTLDKLSASGSSDVYVDGAITGHSLGIHLSGASDFKGGVKVNDLDIDQSGSSDATVSGSVVNLNIEVSGASDVKGYELVAENCTAHASGSSDIRITVNKELNVHASGASDIFYRGTAVIKDMHSSGSSSVSKKG